MSSTNRGACDAQPKANGALRPRPAAAATPAGAAPAGAAEAAAMPPATAPAAATPLTKTRRSMLLLATLLFGKITSTARAPREAGARREPRQAGARRVRCVAPDEPVFGWSLWTIQRE